MITLLIIIRGLQLIMISIYENITIELLEKYGLISEIKNRKLYVKEIDNKMIGYCFIDKIKNNIEILFIRKEFRNQRYGKELLSFVVNNNNCKIFINCDIDNTHAISLYKKLNFKILYKKSNNYYMVYN